MNTTIFIVFVGLFFVYIGSTLNHQSFIAVCLMKKKFCICPILNAYFDLFY